MNSHLYRTLVLISSVNYGITVPPEFCLHALNKDDCNVPPKPVFSYYHPGSRCEIEFWRGCPTRNMFHDEGTCSSVCIYKMNRKPEPIKYTHLSEETDEDDGTNVKSDTDACNEHFNDDDCGQPEEIKYYFADGTCIKTRWTGCESKNLFDDLPACIRACNPIMYFEPNVKEAIKDLTHEEINDVDKLIHYAIQEESYVTELPTLPTDLPQNETIQLLMSIYNITSEEGDYNNFADDYDEEEYVEALSAEHENEADKLAAPDDSVEGSLEEVFTLS